MKRVPSMFIVENTAPQPQRDAKDALFGIQIGCSYAEAMSRSAQACAREGQAKIEAMKAGEK